MADKLCFGTWYSRDIPNEPRILRPLTLTTYTITVVILDLPLVRMFKLSHDTNRTDVDSLELAEVAQLEELQHFIPVQHDVRIPTRNEAHTARTQLLALCWSLFLMGWNDGSTGPLLPTIQKSYGVSFCLFVQLCFPILPPW
jgi:hypothetical protein